MHWVRKLKPFFDANFGLFKDKHQYWVGVMLLVQAILLLETGQANRVQAKSQRLMFNEQGELTRESL